MNSRAGWSKAIGVWGVLLWLALWPGSADAAFPSPQGRVNDFAGVLDASTQAALQGLIQDTEQKTGAEIAVVTVPSLDGMTVEQYAEGMFRAWGIGKKGHDNGVLVLVCPSERKMRIEVGYGLEGVVPDGLAGEIVRTRFTPAFKDGNYSRGVLEGVGRISEIVRANHVLTPEELRTLNEPTDSRPPSWLITPFFGLFIGLGGFALGYGVRTRSVFGLIWGGMFGGIPMLMSLIPFFNAALWVLVPLAIAVFAFGYVKGPALDAKFTSATDTAHAPDGGRRPGRSSSSGHGARSSSRSSWSGSDHDSSSGSSSSSSASSGSSFGGGRSGGGGASGSW